MIDTLSGAPEAPEQIRPTLLERARDTFFAPGRLFASLSADAPFAGVLALATVIAMAAVASELGRGEGDFRRYLVIASHGLLITSAGMFAAVLLRAITSNPDALPTIGTVLGLSDAAPAGRILHSLNLFTLWMLAVVGAGVAAVERNVTRTAATALLWGIYGVVIVAVALLVRA